MLENICSYLILFIYAEVSFYIVGMELYKDLLYNFEYYWNEHDYDSTIALVQSGKFYLIIILNILYILNINKVRTNINKLLKEAIERKEFAKQLRLI